jgi:hypothetical protein
MSRPCEICAPGAAAETPAKRTRRLLVEDRLVALCDEHAAELRLAGVTTLASMRELFREVTGRRSLVSRRAPLDRRVFPARPEGRRRSFGRRAADDRD